MAAEALHGNDTVAKLRRLVLPTVLWILGSAAFSPVSAQATVARPIAPQSETECWAYAGRIDREVAVAYSQKRTVTSTSPWTHSATPHCSNGTMYGPPEWAPYDDAICALNKERNIGLQACLDDVRRAEASITQLNVIRTAADSYATHAAPRVALRTVNASAGGGSFGQSYLKSYGVVTSVNLASAVLELFRNETPPEQKADAAVRAFGAGIKPSFKGNSIAALMSMVASDVALETYARSMSDLQMKLAEFDATGTPNGIGASNLAYPTVYQSALQEVQESEASAARFAALFDERQLTHTGGTVSESSHTRSARAAKSASDEITLRPAARRSYVEERETTQALGKVLADAIVDRYGGKSSSGGARGGSGSSGSSSGCTQAQMNEHCETPPCRCARR